MTLHRLCYADRVELIPVRPIRQMRGFLRGMDTAIEREGDRLRSLSTSLQQNRPTMQAIEFEAMSQQHTIRIPDSAPDGVPMRVLLLWEPVEQPVPDVKKLFSSVLEGLTEEDIVRLPDMGREEPTWDI